MGILGRRGRAERDAAPLFVSFLAVGHVGQPFMQLRGVRLPTAAALAAIWLFVTAFNLTKPVHIDDTAYLEIAQAIRSDPWHAMSAQINWADSKEPIHAVNQPHLFLYFLAAADVFFGPSEVAYHLVEAAFSLAAIVFFYLLARQFAERHALLLTVLFAVSPGFIPSQNVMCDVPMLALWLAFFWSLFAASNGDGGRYVWAASLAAAACLVKYTSLVLLPVLLLDLIGRGQWRRLWVLLIPAGVLAAWSLFNYFDYGGVHLLGRGREPLGLETLWKKPAAWLICLGAISPFSLLLVPHLASTGRGRIVLLSSAMLLGVGWAVQVFHWQYLAGYALLRAGFFVNGCLLAGVTLYYLLREVGQGGILHRSARKVCYGVLLAWLLGAAAFIILFAPFTAVRHVFVACPVVLLVLGERVLPTVRQPWSFGAAVATAVLGVVLGISDWVQADVYREQARAVKEELGDREAVWFVGHWGWQWYARKEGMQLYDMHESEPRLGDYLVEPQLADKQRIAPMHLARLKRVRSVVVESGPATRLRLLTWSPYGGYYSFGIRALPWNLSSAPLEEFVIYQFVR